MEFFTDRTVEAHVMLMSNPLINPASVMLMSITNCVPDRMLASTTALDLFASLNKLTTAGL